VLVSASQIWPISSLGPVSKVPEHFAAHLRAIVDRGSIAQSSKEHCSACEFALIAATKSDPHLSAILSMYFASRLLRVVRR
jgi:hypothetical protein